MDNYPEFSKMHLPIATKHIPRIPYHQSIRYISQKLTANEFVPPAKTDAIRHPLSLANEELIITEALYLGTKDSLSYLSGRKRGTFDLRDQLILGVRFFDFEVSTHGGELWVYSDGKPVMEGLKLFRILLQFVDTLFKLHQYPIYEKILLHFREFECPDMNLMPTLELLGELIVSQFLTPLKRYAVGIFDGGKTLDKIEGAFIIFGPKDLDLALGDNHNFNWGHGCLYKMAPEFDGQVDSVIDWGTLEKYKFSDRKIDPKKLVWLDIFDPKYKGRPGHEFHSLDDIAMVYPTGKVKFNIISFVSLTPDNVKRFISKYKPPPM